MFRRRNEEVRVIRLNIDDLKGLYPAKAEIKVLNVHGKRIGYDVNSMAVYLLDKKEKLPTAYDYEPQFRTGGPGPVSCLVLSVASGCNLGCVYCYRRNYKPDRKSAIMRSDVIKRGIELLDIPGAVQGERPLSVSFFGGEPLLAFEAVKEGTLYAQRLVKNFNERTAESMTRGFGRPMNARLTVGITTNGTLMTQEMCDFLSEHHFGMIYSLDGDEEFHNAQRPMKNGGNSFEAAMRGLEMVKKAGGFGGITLRGSFTGKGGDLVKQVAFLNDLCDQGYADNVAFEPISLAEASCVTNAVDSGIAITMKNVKQFGPQIHDLAQWVVERIRAGKKARLSYFMVFVRRLTRQQPNASDCGAGNSYLTVNAEGQVFACHHEGDCRIGNVWDGLHEQDRAKWLDNRLYLRSQCLDCWMRWACGGGCRMNLIDSKLPMGVRNEIDCWIREKLITESLWIMSELTPGELKEFMHINMYQPGIPAGDKKGCDCDARR